MLPHDSCCRQLHHRKKILFLLHHHHLLLLHLSVGERQAEALTLPLGMSFAAFANMGSDSPLLKLPAFVTNLFAFLQPKAPAAVTGVGVPKPTYVSGEKDPRNSTYETVSFPYNPPTNTKPLKVKAEVSSGKTSNSLVIWQIVPRRETGLALSHKSNNLEKSKIEMSVSKAAFGAEKYKTELEDTTKAEMVTKTMDWLVVSVFDMMVSMLYGAYVFSQQRPLD